MMRIRETLGLAAVLYLAALPPALAESPLQLSLPLACEPHKTCFIQSYVDHDNGVGATDYACGGATYHQHSGVDFRILSAQAAKAGVPVLASADGTVKAVRDGVADAFLKQAKPEDIKGRECGNGVVLDHGAGWETQYCHMKQGSVRVAKGQLIKRGDQLGDVGYSGMADFAHVHLSVRHDGKVIDPFLPDENSIACQKDAKGPGLWQPAAAAAFPYKNGEIISVGFAAVPPDHNALEVDHTQVTLPSRDAPALLFYGRFVNLLTGDRIRLVVDGPGGGLIEEISTALDRNKATYLSYAGKKRGPEPWAAGRYQGRAELVREGAVIATSLGSFDMP